MAAQPVTEYLSPFPVDDVRIPLGGVEVALFNIRTLLETIGEIADSAMNRVSERSAEANREIFIRIGNLAHITLEERMRAQDAFYAGDDVLTAHVIQRIAA